MTLIKSRKTRHLQDYPNILLQVLSYHVVDARLQAAGITNNLLRGTLEGSNMRFNIYQVGGNRVRYLSYLIRGLIRLKSNQDDIITNRVWNKENSRNYDIPMQMVSEGFFYYPGGNNPLIS